jgi:hypothetical protein
MFIRRGLLAFTFLCVTSGVSWAVPFSVFFQPQDSSVQVGASLSVDLLANIPDPVLGWGLDVNYDTSIISRTGVTVGPQWSPATAADGDGLAGLAFPLPISGDNVLLATLSFDALAQGSTALEASATLGDLTEGFALASGGFAEVIYTPGSAAVVPIPAAAWLFGSGLLALVGIARRKKAA